MKVGTKGWCSRRRSDSGRPGVGIVFFDYPLIVGDQSVRLRVLRGNGEPAARRESYGDCRRVGGRALRVHRVVLECSAGSRRGGRERSVRVERYPCRKRAAGVRLSRQGVVVWVHRTGQNARAAGFVVVRYVAVEGDVARHRSATNVSRGQSNGGKQIRTPRD